MASGPEHYQKAEQLLQRLADKSHSPEAVAAIATSALAYATLAQTATIALQAPVVGSSGRQEEPAGLAEGLYNEWAEVAGNDS